MTVTSKKHPSETKIRGALKDGKLTALDIDICYDSGAYSTLSMVVLQRGIISAPGVYKCDDIKVHGTAARTNGSLRRLSRFGGAQVFFAIERFMDHLAEKAGLDPVDFKIANTAVQGDLDIDLRPLSLPRSDPGNDRSGHGGCGLQTQAGGIFEASGRPVPQGNRHVSCVSTATASRATANET